MNLAPRPTLRCGDRQLVLGARTFVMGIVNVTPDSFSDGGRYIDVEDAVDHAWRLQDDGADIIDIGGESTRPGASELSIDEERRRVLPVIEALALRGMKNISVDTRHAVVAKDAVAAGAAWVNDVDGLTDPAMIAVAQTAQAAVIMHRRVIAKDAVDHKEDRVTYDDVVEDVAAFLNGRVAHAALGAGVGVVVDPGLGFGKSVADNLRLLRNAGHFRSLGAVLIGASRKRFVGALLGRPEGRAEDRDAASVGAACAAAVAGADIVRVHAVKDTVDALRIVDAAQRGNG